MLMKTKTNFFCVLCFIIAVLSQINFGYTIDFGTDYASVMSTGQSYSEVNVLDTRYIFINILGWIILVILFVSNLFLYGKVCKTSLVKSFFIFTAVFFISLIVTFGNFTSENRYFSNVVCIYHLAFLSVCFLILKFFGVSYKKIIIVSIAAMILWSMSLPNIHSSRWQARQKACYSNIRVLTSAVEMFNMDVKDSSEFIQDFNKEKMEKLVKHGYLKSSIKCPEYYSNEYVNIGKLADTGEISCGADPFGDTIQNRELKGHGTLDGLESLKNDERYKQVMEENIKRILKVREQKKFNYYKNYSLSDFYSSLLGKEKPY